MNKHKLAEDVPVKQSLFAGKLKREDELRMGPMVCGEDERDRSHKKKTAEMQRRPKVAARISV